MSNIRLWTLNSTDCIYTVVIILKELVTYYHQDL